MCEVRVWQSCIWWDAICVWTRGCMNVCVADQVALAEILTCLRDEDERVRRAAVGYTVCVYVGASVCVCVWTRCSRVYSMCVCGRQCVCVWESGNMYDSQHLHLFAFMLYFSDHNHNLQWLQIMIFVSNLFTFSRRSSDSFSVWRFWISDDPEVWESVCVYIYCLCKQSTVCLNHSIKWEPQFSQCSFRKLSPKNIWKQKSYFESFVFNPSWSEQNQNRKTDLLYSSVR